MATMKVITGGFLVTIQDQGRSKCQQLGLAEAGAMDKHAFLWGNKLLGNNPASPSLEILVGNTSFEFEKPSHIAITGAEMDAKLNGLSIPNWQVTPINAGDKLSFGVMKTGLRAYLAIENGFEETEFFSSSSTVIREQTGGNNGQKLQKGDELRYAESNMPLPIFKVPAKWIPNYNEDLTLHFIPGYHYEEFSSASLSKFSKSNYTVSNDADRMGYRLSGFALERNGDNILSIGVPCGAIQVPSAGEPIILLNDRQCTGGYPILGVISSRDIFRLAQRKGGDIVRFKKANIQSLKHDLAEFYNFFYGNNLK
ncbi:MAG: biotin-dependent carboxyltransferase family protein [Desulfotalea sp.]